MSGIKPRSEMTPAERRAARRRQKRQRALREQGKSLRIKPHEFDEVYAHAKDLHDRGMSFRQMSEQTGERVGRHVIGNLLRMRKTLARESYEAIMSIRYEEPDQMGSLQDATGIYRRIEALRAIGFSELFLAEWLGMKPANIRFQAGHAVSLANARKIREMYDKLEHADPRDFGITGGKLTRILNCARKNGFAPPHCWDEDTIEDPKAIPEWTGRCGTLAGRNIHRREGIPTCAPCRKAWSDMQRERQGVERTEGEFDREAFSKLFESRGLTFAELEKKSGFHHDSLKSWRNGRRCPHPNNISRLAAALGVQPEELIK